MCRPVFVLYFKLLSLKIEINIVIMLASEKAAGMVQDVVGVSAHAI